MIEPYKQYRIMRYEAVKPKSVKIFSTSSKGLSISNIDAYYDEYNELQMLMEKLTNNLEQVEERVKESRQKEQECLLMLQKTNYEKKICEHNRNAIGKQAVRNAEALSERAV